MTTGWEDGDGKDGSRIEIFKRMNIGKWKLIRTYKFTKDVRS
jgi:hypothetical protein